MNDTKSKHLDGVKELIFTTVLMISGASFFLISFINLFNKRPIANFTLPFFASIIVSIMYRFYIKKRYSSLIKIIFLVFLSVFYLPAAWLTSPGSYSAMSFYAMLLLFLVTILAQKKWEYIFPVLVVVETVAFLNYEPLKPEQYTLYSDPYARALDLSINYIVACTIMFSLLLILNTYFDKEHNRIFKTSITDQLTGIYNRRYIHESLELMYDEKGYKRVNFSIIMIDLNNFKRVNDKYGHNVGDDVLKEFALILSKASRKNDVVGRYGGDEFILVLYDADVKNSRLVEQRILELFKPLEEKYKDIGLSVGIGIAESRDLKIDDIIKLADDHLYKDKSRKKTILSAN